MKLRLAALSESEQGRGCVASSLGIKPEILEEWEAGIWAPSERLQNLIIQVLEEQLQDRFEEQADLGDVIDGSFKRARRLKEKDLVEMERTFSKYEVIRELLETERMNWKNQMN